MQDSNTPILLTIMTLLFNQIQLASWVTIIAGCVAIIWGIMQIISKIIEWKEKYGKKS
jgi:hypothetical protein